MLADRQRLEVLRTVLVNAATCGDKPTSRLLLCDSFSGSRRRVELVVRISPALHDGSARSVVLGACRRVILVETFPLVCFALCHAPNLQDAPDIVCAVPYGAIATGEIRYRAVFPREETMRDLAIAILSAAELTAAQVKRIVEVAGYANVQDVKKEGYHFDAWATARDGKRVCLHVDANTGFITQERKNEKNEHKQSSFSPAR